MRFLDRIIGYILDIALFFLDLSHEVRDWGNWARWAADFLVDVADAFARMAYQFEKFNDWVSYVADMVEDILNLTEIRLALKTWLDYATWAWNWVRNAWYNVKAIIDDWWGTVIPTVYGWIDEAKQWASLQIDSLETKVNSILANVNELLAQIPDVSELIAWFSNWWGNILANLGTWWDDRLLDVQGLIDSAFVIRESFWAGWQDIRDKVFDFFDDPLEWLLVRFTDWFLGPEA